ncbi:MAG: EAL domain-containing protein [Tranquillimonas sp.]
MPARGWIGQGLRHRLARGTVKPLAIAATLPLVLLAIRHAGGDHAYTIATLGLAAIATAIMALRPSGLISLADSAALPQRIDLERQLAANLQKDREGARTTCLLIAPDEFDALQSRLGDRSAAEAMDRTAERVLAHCRGTDFVARLPGHRLAVAPAPSGRLDLDSTLELAARLQSACAEPLRLHRGRADLTVSVGLAQSDPASQMDAEALLAGAETALATARREGPNKIRAFTRTMGSLQAVKADLVRDLTEALDSGAIRPWIQPQISTDTGALTGVEALARWDHPRHGTLPPSEFRPAIRAGGLSDRLADRMLSRALLALAGWDRDGVEVPRVSVNFSEAELADPSLPDRVSWELDRFGLAPHRLGIEVLETVVARDAGDVIIRNLAALKTMGCYVDLDDFGTGHASISAIRQLSVHRLKIDRSFVRGADTDSDQRAMVAAMLTMAEQLSLDTLAEGVETRDEHAMMAQLGVAHVQGYAIAKPMPPEALPAWLMAHRGALPPALALGRGTRAARRQPAGGNARPGPARPGKTP